MDSLDCLNQSTIKLLVRNGLLVRLVKLELLKEILIKVSVDNNINEEFTNNFRKRNKIETEAQFQEWLIKNNISEDNFKVDITKNFRIEKYAKESFGHKVETAFLKSKDQLDKVIYSLIRVKDIFKAKELHLRISEDDADFGKLALEHSEGPERLSRGIVGPISLQQAHPILREALKHSKNGELKEVISIGEYHLIVRVECNMPAQLDEEMQVKIAKQLFDQSLEAEAQTIANGIIKKIN